MTNRWIAGLGLFALLLVPRVGEAQAAVGVRAGLRSAELEASQPTGSIDDLVLGGYLGFGLSSRLALQVEVVYGTRGGTGLRVGGDSLDSDAPASRLDMTYVEVPLLLRAGFPGQRLLPSVFLGPYVGFLLGCDLRPEGADARACDTEDVAERFVPRGTDFGVLAGAGLDVRMGDNTVFLDARYSIGLFSVHSDENPFDARHTGFSITGGFAVPVGRE